MARALGLDFGTTNTVAATDPDSRERIIDSLNPKHSIKAVTVEQVFEKVVHQLSTRSDEIIGPI